MDVTEGELYQIKRRRAGIRLENVAEVMGCHYTYLSKWERGERKLPEWLREKYKQYIDDRQ